MSSHFIQKCFSCGGVIAQCRCRTCDKQVIVKGLCKSCAEAVSLEREWINDEYPDILLMDGYDDCIIGVCNRFNQEPIVAYDQDKVIKKLRKDGMTCDEAVEFFEFNQMWAWVGDLTPCFITPIPRKNKKKKK